MILPSLPEFIMNGLTFAAGESEQQLSSHLGHIEPEASWAIFIYHISHLLFLVKNFDGYQEYS